MAFNISLIWLYDIDVGMIPWNGWNLFVLWIFKKASLSAIKRQLFEITSF